MACCCPVWKAAPSGVVLQAMPVDDGKFPGLFHLHEQMRFVGTVKYEPFFIYQYEQDYACAQDPKLMDIALCASQAPAVRITRRSIFIEPAIHDLECQLSGVPCVRINAIRVELYAASHASETYF